MTTAVTPLSGAGPSLYQAQTDNLTKNTQDRFLMMLMTQLKNQDPLNPMDNAQVTTQMAQLSTVNGINQLNNTLLALSGQLDVGQSMQAAALIGKGVLIPGDKVALGVAGDGTLETTPVGVDLVRPAGKLIVSVVNDSGQVVRKMELENQSAGVLTLEWDGCDDAGNAAPAGKYRIQVAAMNEEGEAVPATALTYGKVESIAYTSEGLRLEMGLAGSASLLDLRKIM